MAPFFSVAASPETSFGCHREAILSPSFRFLEASAAITRTSTFPATFPGEYSAMGVFLMHDWNGRMAWPSLNWFQFLKGNTHSLDN